MFRFCDVVVEDFEERFGRGVAPAFDTDRENYKTAAGLEDTLDKQYEEEELM